MDRTLEVFRLADATAPGRAQSLDRLGLPATRTVTRLIEAGVIVPVPGKNAVYLSEQALVGYRGNSAARAMWVALAGIMALLAGLAVFFLVGRAKT